MNTENMLYNSQMNTLIISEYGRNIQNMIEAVKVMEDDKKRQEFAEAIVDLMHQMHPTDKHNPDSRSKLWRHLFKIAGYDINVTAPENMTPTPENTFIEPTKIEYPENIRKFRHYGKNVQILVEKAVQMEDDEKRQEFTMIIAAYMKLAYRTWNREHFVSDEIIKEDLKTMSDGKLDIPGDQNIVVSAPMPSRNQFKRRKKGPKSGGRRKTNFKSNHRNGGRSSNGRSRRR